MATKIEVEQLCCADFLTVSMTQWAHSVHWENISFTDYKYDELSV